MNVATFFAVGGHLSQLEGEQQRVAIEQARDLVLRVLAELEAVLETDGRSMQDVLCGPITLSPRASEMRS